MIPPSFLLAIKALWEHSQSQLIINAKCKYGWTPLYTAIHHGSTEAAKFLIEIGADIHFATTLGIMHFFVA